MKLFKSNSIHSTHSTQKLNSPKEKTKKMKSLSQMNLGETAKIKEIDNQNNILTRLKDMGLTLGSNIKLLVRLPFGGNLVILSDYGKYTLHKDVAKQIKVQATD